MEVLRALAIWRKNGRIEKKVKPRQKKNFVFFPSFNGVPFGRLWGRLYTTQEHVGNRLRAFT